ncbi:spore coat protein GerQ [Paenibacillus sp. PL91]|uniref:spore coat protein GerQ n=1 Tax=Paenibacillus sp. PL91 TaxID=2729538 RepID=UPI00145D87E1|nr:spore coat protein GerQ [Paenibacillus sp. PL91]MBC9200313.1 spore coat protein GerQ [Paenibacillus sp. PL91]
MSNGYGHKNQVSPANVAPIHGYGYGGYGNYPQTMGGQATTLPATMPMQMPMQQMPMQQMPMQQMTMQQVPPTSVPSGSFVTPSGGNIVTLPAVEESYVENILRLNRGKMATFYMTYENNREWNAKIFKGIIEAAGRDHIVISDPTTGMRYLLLTLNLDYVTFDEPIAYEYPFQGSVVSSSTPLGMATIGTVNSSR